MLGLAVAAAGLGGYGLWRYEVDNLKHADLWSVGYHTLQLFVLHSPHLDYEVNWQLHAGRWIAASVVLLAVIKAATKVFGSECRLFWARWTRGHVVICGLGRVGLQLAREFRRKGVRVVAIEAREEATHTAIAHDMGLAVLTGDATHLSILRRAAVTRARQVVAVCDDEQTNVAIAARLGELLATPGVRRNSPDPLECWIFLPDTRLRRVFQHERLFPYVGGAYRVNVGGLDLFSVAARQAFARSPLDFERISATDPTVVHLVIVGFGPMGQRLALQAALVGHFANLQKLKITVADRKNSPRCKEFMARYPKISEICDFSVKDVSIEEADTASQLASWIPLQDRRKALTTFALCWDSGEGPITCENDMFQRLERDDSTNLSLALDVSKSATGGESRFLVFQTRKDGFAALFPIQGRGEDIGARINAFGMLEEICSLETLLHEREDKIARALHEDYYDNHIANGNKPGSKPALYHWEALADRFKDSNRYAADHIPIKLRALGYRVDHKREDLVPLTSIPYDRAGGDRSAVEILAKMEHARWCADMLLQNFVLGERNDAGLTHDCLKSWEDLNDGTREWDRQQVRAIPKALDRAGCGIYPQTQ